MATQQPEQPQHEMREALVGEPLPPIEESLYAPGATPLEPSHFTSGDHRMAKNIRVVQSELGGPQVFIDGALFPYFTAMEPKLVKVGRRRLPTLVLEIVAETIDVRASIDKAE